MDATTQSLGSYDPALVEAVREGDPDEVVAVIVRINDSTSLPAGACIKTQFGDIATLRIARSRLPELAYSESVIAMEASRRLRAPPNDYEQCSNRQNLGTYTRRPEGVSGTGRGVIVGSCDFGFDFAHPAFRNADGSTRILALWNQGGEAGGEPASRWGYGRIFTADAINDALSQPDPYSALGYSPFDSDPVDAHSGESSGAHATHVLHIAAGNGRGGGLSGVAPEAGLVCVHLFRTNPVLGTGNFGDSATLLEGLDFIFSTAGDRPCVVNMSVGAHGGPHDGTTCVEQGIDAAVWLEPGRAVVCSAGNYFGRRMHAEGRVIEGGEYVLPFMVPERDPTESEIEVFYASSDRFVASIVDPSGRVLASIGPEVDEPLIVSGRTVGHLYHYLRQRTSEDHHIDIFFRPYAPGGRWELRLRGEAVLDGRFHAWIERDRGLSPWFLPADVTQTSTTGTICNGRYSITVGAYDPFETQRPIGSFSSAGPTRDGRFKPELVAPGKEIPAARSTPQGEAPGPRYVCKDGTSMAAPHVTGAVALMFEAAGAPMPITDTRALLFTTAERVQPDAANPADLHRVGYGYLDIVAAEAGARRWRGSHVRSDGGDAELTEHAGDSDWGSDSFEFGGTIRNANGSSEDFLEMEWGEPEGNMYTRADDEDVVIASPGDLP